MQRPVVHRRDPRLEILTEAIERLIPGATPTFLTVTVTETLPRTGEQKHRWTGSPEGLAQRQFTALYGRPRGDAPYGTRLEAITATLRQPVPDVTPADLISGAPAGLFDPSVAPVDRRPPWGMQTDILARRIYTALYGTPAAEQSSPLAQAEDAKRNRDLVGELGALMAAGDALESAPWYPTRPGDLVHVHHAAVSDWPAFGETYIVGDAGDGLLSMQLLAHTLPDTVEHAAALTGCFTAESAVCPVYELWFEAGPHVLTIVRDGRPVHVGGAR